MPRRILKARQPPLEPSAMLKWTMSWPFVKMNAWYSFIIHDISAHLFIKRHCWTSLALRCIGILHIKRLYPSQEVWLLFWKCWGQLAKLSVWLLTVFRITLIRRIGLELNADWRSGLVGLKVRNWCPCPVWSKSFLQRCCFAFQIT